MHPPTPLFLAREAERLGSDRDLRRRIDNDTVVRLATGVYVDRSAWDTLDDDARYRARVVAASLISSPESQFSHDSAAAMWRLPTLGPWPATAHEVVEPQRGGSSRVGIRRHALGLDAAFVTIDDARVTSLARTLVDVSCTTSLVRAVAMIDCGLRSPTVGEPRAANPTTTSTVELIRTLDALLPYRGSVRARQAIEFGSALSESVGESFARVQFHALGYPSPELQVEFDDEDGAIGTVDFFWPELGLIVEFDGRSKYGTRRAFQRNLSLEQILLAEKAREDRLRRQVRSFARLDWARVADRRALAAYLRPHGLVERRRRASPRS